MESKDNIQAFHAETRDDWRKWLERNHQKEQSVWLIIYHKTSRVPSVYYEEAVEEALCFGWIDSKGNKRDEESSYLYFAPRKPKSNWSKPNRERADRMIEKGLMMPAGQKAIDLAKSNNTWNALADIENLVIPDDLQKLFDLNETAFLNFQKFPPSSKRIILYWIHTAKKPETRQKRIDETVVLAGQNKRANHR